MTGSAQAPLLKVEHGPVVCNTVPCAVCWAPGGLGLNDKGECAQACAYGTCGGSGYTACGGCCGCRGGCIVQWENQQPRASAEDQ